MSPPDAKLSTIGQWVWLIPLKAVWPWEEVSLTPTQLISLLQGPLLILRRGDTFITYASWGGLPAHSTLKRAKIKSSAGETWNIIVQHQGMHQYNNSIRYQPNVMLRQCIILRNFPNTRTKQQPSDICQNLKVKFYLRPCSWQSKIWITSQHFSANDTKWTVLLSNPKIQTIIMWLCEQWYNPQIDCIIVKLAQHTQSKQGLRVPWGICP